MAETDSVKKVIELVGNLPLALKIISAMMQIQKGRSFTDYAKSLDEQLNHLKNLKYRGDKNLDLKASFLLSLDLLKSEEKDFFACLSVCAKDGFTVHTAMIVTGCDKRTVEDTLFYLYRLSLIDSPEVNRFSFHPLIHRFANEIAIERSLLEIAAERHAKFYERFLRNIDLNDQYNVNYAIEQLKEILIAVDWLQQHNRIDYELAVKLESFLQDQGLWYRASELMAGFLELPVKIEDRSAFEHIHNHQDEYSNLSQEGKTK